jgi:hypothetical protein
VPSNPSLPMNLEVLVGTQEQRSDWDLEDELEGKQIARAAEPDIDDEEE